MIPSPTLPVVVVGAGPIGLATAAHLAQRDIPHVVLESGETAAAGVRSWGHVRLFSPWAELVDAAAEKVLAPTGWVAPEPGGHPTGAEWTERYLAPLAEALGDVVRTGHRVTAISRQGADVLADHERAERPFTVHVQTPDGPARLLAAAVVDASGTIRSPNPAGADGVPAAGEAEVADRITAGVPDIADPAVAARHAGAHTVVVGSGHTAMNAVLDLRRLVAEQGGRISWVHRRRPTADTFGGGSQDQLVARGALGQAARAATEDDAVTVVAGFRIEAIVPGAPLALLAEDGRTIDGVDRIVTATGYRPDLAMTEELRLDLDPAVKAPRALAPLIDPNVHSCGTVPPHGAAELAHPEPGFFTVGMKSYGRAPTFLALTGYEQVRSVVAKLAGDEAAAAEVQLQLPETGVCGGTGLSDVADGDLAQGDACGVTPGGLPLLGGQAGGCC